MRTLIVYYSRTGITKKIAEKLKEKLNADLEEIVDPTNRQGALGYLKSGKEAMRQIPAKIEPIKSDLSAYELIIVGTPIWAYNMCSPVRAFLNDNKDKISQVAFYATEGGSGSDKAFVKMAKILGREPKAILTLLTKDVVQENYSAKLDEFINLLK